MSIVRGFVGALLTLSLVTTSVSLSRGAEPMDPGQDAVGRTPPRLSFVHGEVSFWRPGAQDWAQAQINTPLAPGDQLYTGPAGNLELQVGGRAFVRAWGSTQIGLESQEPDFLQFKVTGGRTAFDLRTLEPGRTVEVNTPSAAFTIEHPGYYRLDVAGDRTSFITRRSGRALVTPASGEAFAIAASEEIVLEGSASPRISSYAAPELDEWDKWNYARSDALLEAVSARYVSPGTYGVDDLDRYGTWRVVDTYGPIWVPTGVPAGWVPYSTGSWMLDPFYGWTWVDTAPWGWAPYHYGRWVHVNGYWAWAPGPAYVRSVYAPALVAFFGGPGGHVSVGIGGPIVGWVALGWGEPCVPWWGRPGFIHRPWWGGWAGPRVVNNVVIHRTTVVNVHEINVYRNARIQNAVVAVHEDRFGRGRIASARVAHVDMRHLQPVHAGPKVTATPASFVPTARRGMRPPEENLKRPVVATRQPHRSEASPPGHERKAGPGGSPEPAPHMVKPPERGEPAGAVARPPFGQSTIERSAPYRRPAPPRPRSDNKGAEQAPEPVRPTPTTPRPELQGRGQTSPQPRPNRAEAPAQPSASEPSARQADRRRPTGSPGREVGRSDQVPGQPTSARQAAPSRSEAQVGAPRPVAPRPSVGREKESTPPAARPAAPRPAAKPLPGEPASRLAPNRGEPRAARQEMERQHKMNGQPNPRQPKNGPQDSGASKTRRHGESERPGERKGG